MPSNKELRVVLKNKNHGYFLARSPNKENRLKLQVKQGANTIYYDLTANGVYEIFPLQFGNGEYLLTLYKEVLFGRYASAGQIRFNVLMEDENETYIHHNQYVPEDAEATKIAKDLVGESSKKTFLNMVKHIRDNFSYDFVKSHTVTKNETLPDIKGCLKNKMGICQDLASLAASMLRSVDIPAKLVIGYAGNRYHAWIEALIDGKWVLYDPTMDVSNLPTPKKYVTERWY